MADLTSNQVCNICCIHYNAGLRCCALGSLVEGGYLFAKNGSIAWIIACSSRQVGRTWELRNDAVTTAQAGNACGDWFVPSVTELLFGFDCKSFWDSFSSASYWTSSSFSTSGLYVNRYGACRVPFRFGSCTFCVRAFRRVFY